MRILPVSARGRRRVCAELARVECRFYVHRRTVGVIGFRCGRGKIILANIVRSRHFIFGDVVVSGPGLEAGHFATRGGDDEECARAVAVARAGGGLCPLG